MSLGQGGEQERRQRARDPQRLPGAPDLWRQHARDWHGGQAARSRGEQHHREASVGEAEERLDLGDRHRPRADAEAVGEEDRGDAKSGAQKTVRPDGVHR